MAVVQKCIRCKKYLTEADQKKTDDLLDPEDAEIEAVLCNECYDFENKDGGADEE